MFKNVGKSVETFFNRLDKGVSDWMEENGIAVDRAKGAQARAEDASAVDYQVMGSGLKGRKVVMVFEGDDNDNNNVLREPREEDPNDLVFPPVPDDPLPDDEAASVEVVHASQAPQSKDPANAPLRKSRHEQQGPQSPDCINTVLITSLSQINKQMVETGMRDCKFCAHIATELMLLYDQATRLGDKEIKQTWVAVILARVIEVVMFGILEPQYTGQVLRFINVTLKKASEDKEAPPLYLPLPKDKTLANCIDWCKKNKGSKLYGDEVKLLQKNLTELDKTHQRIRKHEAALQKS